VLVPDIKYQSYQH